MPNLLQLQNLKRKYGSGWTNLGENDIGTLLESFDPNRIEKGFVQKGSKWMTRSFSFKVANPDIYIDYFLERKKATVVLLFIDITSFSQKFVNKTPEDLMKYLDEYYKKVIPTIAEHGGEIEKIMGDGIVCVFGEPFLDEPTQLLHTYADNCARKIISDLQGTEYECKIALHFGEIMYYQNPSESYYEYTMIGNAITELFRLESVSFSNSINFYGNTYFDNHINKLVNEYELTVTPYGREANPPHWTYKAAITVNLSGVPYQTIRRIEKN